MRGPFILPAVGYRRVAAIVWSEWQDLNLRPPAPEHWGLSGTWVFIGIFARVCTRKITFCSVVSVAGWWPARFVLPRRLVLAPFRSDWSLLKITAGPFWKLSTRSLDRHTVETDTECGPIEHGPYLYLGPNGLTPRWDFF
jgi:hypothetical protein